MDWKISDIDEIFSIDLAERDGLITVSSINIDGQDTELPEVIISKLDDRSRVSVDINGNLRFAHVAKVGDKWWIHYDGDIFTNVSDSKCSCGGSCDSCDGSVKNVNGEFLNVLSNGNENVNNGGDYFEGVGGYSSLSSQNMELKDVDNLNIHYSL